MQTLIQNTKILNIATTRAAATTTQQHGPVDMSGWDSVCFMGRFKTANANNKVNAAQSTASGGTFSALAGTSVGNKTHWRLDIHRPRERWLKLVVHRGSVAYGDVWAILYNGRRLTTITDNVGEFHASPTEGTA